MATYRSIASTETDADSPVTVQLMDALRQNPEAIAEGASGAPQVQPAALAVFDTTGSIGAGSGVVATSSDLTNVDRALIVGFVNVTTGSGGVASVTYELSADGGSTWGSAVTIASQQSVSANTQWVTAAHVVDVSSHNLMRVSAAAGGAITIAASTFSILHVA